MAQPAKRRATYEDLLKVPDHLVAEIINGDLIIRSRPALPRATEADDRARKMPINARERVAHAWLINLLTRTLEIYAIDSTRRILVGTFKGDTQVRPVPFDAIELDLADLWAD